MPCNGRNMKRVLLVSFLMIISVLSCTLSAQKQTNDVVQDSLVRRPVTLIAADTLTASEAAEFNKNVKVNYVENFQPNPTKAVIYSAIFPGLGQIYNKKYWKLPIVYGGFLGVMYAVTWNGNMYNDYKRGYRDLVLNPRGTTSWHSFVSDPDRIKNDFNEIESLKGRLKRQRDTFRRQRDLAIIVGVGLYALCMIDAYVDAHLYNFTVTPDLSMTMAPVVWGPSTMSNSFTVGFQCNVVF